LCNYEYNVFSIATIILGFVTCPPASASAPSSQPTEPESSGAAQPWERLTGDWLGLRPALSERGVTFEAAYSFDAFLNAHGGRNTHDSDTYFGYLDVSVTLDSKGLGLWDGGQWYAAFQDFRGESISDRHVGDLLLLNNDEAPNRSQLAQFWYEQSLFEDLVRIRIGKMDGNEHFALNDTGADFINSGFAFPPMMPIPTFPDPGLGFELFLKPTQGLTLSGGVFDADAAGSRSGFDTAFHGRDDSFSIGELSLAPHEMGECLPGVYRVGGWYHSGEWDVYFNDLGGRRAPRSHRGNAGVYVSLEQQVRAENPDVADDEQGLAAFFHYGWAPSSYNEITSYYGAGVVYTGLIPGRDADATGLAINHSSLSGDVQRLERRFGETVFEAYHTFSVTEFLSVRPDVQYILDPGGSGRDAIAIGVRIELAF
jgi:porin